MHAYLIFTGSGPILILTTYPDVVDPRLVTKDATAEGLYQGMVRFLDDIAREEGLGARCRRYAEQHLAWDGFVDGLEEISGELARK